MADITCIGFALGFAFLKCTTPDAAPSGRAPYCDVINQAGGAKKPSRKDTLESALYMKQLHAAWAANCPVNPFPKPMR
jgi:hypothetical protein